MTGAHSSARWRNGNADALWRYARRSAPVREFCFRAGMITLAILIALVARSTIAFAGDTAVDSDGRPRLKAYEEVKDFYELAMSNDPVCADYLDAVNGQKIYDPNDERDLLLGSAVNDSWEILFASGKWAVPPSGNWGGHRISRDEWIHDNGSIEQLAVDLDDDGEAEYLYRRTAQIKSRSYHEVILLDHQATTYDIRYLLGYTEPPGKWNPRSMEKDMPPREVTRRLFPEVDSDFFLIEVIGIKGRHFLVATSAFHGQLARTYVMKVRQNRSVDLVCFLKSKFIVGKGN